MGTDMCELFCPFLHSFVQQCFTENLLFQQHSVLEEQYSMKDKSLWLVSTYGTSIAVGVHLQGLVS